MSTSSRWVGPHEPGHLAWFQCSPCQPLPHCFLFKPSSSERTLLQGETLVLQLTVRPHRGGSGRGIARLQCQAAPGGSKRSWGLSGSNVSQAFHLPTPMLSQFLIETCKVQSPAEIITRIFWRTGTDYTLCRDEDESNSGLTKPSGQQIRGHPALIFAISVLSHSWSH